MAEAAAAAAPPSQQAGQAAPPAAGLPRDPTFADLTGAARASDAESVARAQASGAPQSAAELQAILDSAYKASVYQYIYAKVGGPVAGWVGGRGLVSFHRLLVELAARHARHARHASTDP